MSEVFKAYTALSPSSSRTDVRSVLASIISAPPFAFDENTRQELIKALLKDIKQCSSNGGASKGKLVPKDAPQALLAVKTLGKHPSGSAIIAEPTNLTMLLEFASVPAFKDYPDAASEALRSIANALLLIDTARSTWISKEVGGGEASIVLLDKATTPERIFLASRILFLCTAFTAPAASYIRNLVESKRNGSAGSAIDIIGTKLDTLTNAILAGTKMAKDAMTDLLKFTFNLLLHYPKLIDCEPQNGSEPNDDHKVMGDYWSPKLDGILAPLLRVFNSLPPSFPSPLAPPLTHAIHGLITVPISPALRPIWFNQFQTASSRSSTSSTRQAGSGSSTRSGSPSAPQRATPTAALSISGNGNGNTSPSSATPKPSTLDRALSVLSAGARSLSGSGSRSASPAIGLSSADTLLRAYDLLDVSLAHYFPGNIDPDDLSVRERCKAENGDTTLDELMSPLIVLITRLCLADETSRTRVRELIVPPDLDRSNPLESRSDILGRCLRLLGSVYHPRLKDALGEMLFAMCDSDAQSLSAHVGYGNVAGFLFNKGIMSAPPSTSGTSNAPLTTPSGAAINPITGTVTQKVEMPDMTDEEKEREAEKLFVLFDRLEKTGTLPPDQNPVRKAIQEGKFGAP